MSRLKPISAVPSNIPLGIKLIITFFFVGYFPIAPGTIASLAAFALYFPLLALNQWIVYLASAIVVTLVGAWASGRAEEISGIIDPSFVVIDEVAGQLITLFLLPFSWKVLVAGFVLFRLFDVIKPFPARRLEKMHGGWGIMMDDVLVGVYANILLHLAVFLWPNLLI
jgi:phosphatidylglycerophosphatase A